MPTQPWGTEKDVPSDVTIDSFAQRILEKHSASAPDDSLGAYVTSLLRMADLNPATKIEDIPDIEGVVELIQEHCGISTEAEAVRVLQIIVTMMVEKRMPPSAASPLFFPQENSPPPSLNIGEVNQFHVDANCTPKSLLSPERADSLLPQDLLEDDYDDAAPEMAPTADAQLSAPPTGVVDDAKTSGSTPGDAAFPPLSASANKQRQRTVEDQQSDEATASTVPTSGESSPDVQVAQGGFYSESGAEVYHPDPYQYEAAKDMLLAMNLDLSLDAAYAAVELTKADVHAAQYVLHAASTAPPICRHLLGSGCYRRDCAFSHDVQDHTCLFWMRGRCGKGESCQFLHGFSAVHLPPQQELQQSTNMEESFPLLPGANEPVVPPSEGSFANIASMGYSSKASFSDKQKSPVVPTRRPKASEIPTAQIPMDLWTMHENRDSGAFHIADPLERYYQVMANSKQSKGLKSSRDGPVEEGIVDLHFQSLKTFETVLLAVLPEVLQTYESVWIVTGTGHHVGSRTHQKGGGALESAVLEWLIEQLHNGSAPYRKIHRGKDRNGQGGALLVSK